MKTIQQQIINLGRVLETESQIADVKKLEDNIALKNIAHDCQVIIDFIESIDLTDWQDMFIKIKI
ncbi:hypothetical protein [Trichormus variabilis]|nr:hypothetical protein [Trichormus variabilis]MBD2627467.1 hypothetical protein [Trichormus variabilis FACHB-164]